MARNTNIKTNSPQKFKQKQKKRYFLNIKYMYKNLFQPVKKNCNKIKSAICYTYKRRMVIQDFNSALFITI